MMGVDGQEKLAGAATELNTSGPGIELKRDLAGDAAAAPSPRRAR